MSKINRIGAARLRDSISSAGSVVHKDAKLIASKSERQALFLSSNSSCSPREVVRKAKLIPDVSQDSFSIIKICA